MLFCASLHGQSQIRKHTLFFYPFHTHDAIGDYGNLRNIDVKSFIRGPQGFMPRKENLLLGLGYHFHFRENWVLQAKFFAMQNFKMGRFGQRSLEANKRMKLGLQHFILNRKWQIGLGYSFYYRKEERLLGFLANEIFAGNVFMENELGLELGIGLAYRFGEHARVFIGNALHYGARGSNIKNNFVKEFIPFESLGFGYTF